MAVFGVTGNLASGKSTLVKLFKKKGAVIFDADKQVKRYYKDKNSRVYRLVSAVFPQAVKNNSLSCKELAEIVFSDRKKLYRLEKIIHPFVIKDLKRWVVKAKDKEGIFIAEVPLLFEKKLDNFFDGIILVFVKRDILLKRIREKLNLSVRGAQKRLALFKPIKEKIKGADFVIDNNKGIKEFNKEAGLLWDKLKNFEMR